MPLRPADHRHLGAVTDRLANLARWVTRLLRDRRGVFAVEFAVVALAFLGLLFFIIALAFRLYVQVALDYASGQAARLLAVDTTQNLSKNSPTFQSVTVCPLLAAFLSCQNVTISLLPVTSYANGSGNGTVSFNAGQSGSLMLLELTYSMPKFSWPMPDGSGSSTFLDGNVASYFPYMNEY